MGCIRYFAVSTSPCFNALMLPMRITLTLDAEITERLMQEANSTRQSFEQVVNSALKRGLNLVAPRKRQGFRVNAHSSTYMPGVEPRHLNRVIDEL